MAGPHGRPAVARAVATPLVAGALVMAAILGACSGDGGDQEAFCATATDTDRLDSIVSELDPTDVDAAVTTFQEAKEAEEELRSHAPEAVRADIDVLISYLDDLVEGLRSAETPEGERPAIYAELQSRTDQVEAASARLALYVETNC